jgi:hypothetical protein
MTLAMAKVGYNVGMARPLDYRNPKRRDDPPEPQPALPIAPRAAVPLEFDAKLTQTKDHAAAHAIEVALTKARIAFFRTDDAAHADRQVELFVRAADFTQASQFAAEVFVRRKKFKGFAPVEPLPQWLNPRDRLG